jgi:ceramide glucosyltransferase
LLICDAADTATVTHCREWVAAHPQLDAQVILVDGSDGEIATKVEKLLAALPSAAGAILAFVDDDILLRPDALESFACYLGEPRAGAVFGLAVYTNWSNVPSSLLSAFVNANALLSYLPLTYLAEPYTITGHFYALRREVFAAIGRLEGMEGRFDDDHELARRVQQSGLANVQTPVMYDVDNRLETFYDYANQMRRWFVIPKQTMAPYLTPHQQFVSLLGSIGNLIPPALALLAAAAGMARWFAPRGPHTAPAAPAPNMTTVAHPTRTEAMGPLLVVMALFAGAYAWCEHAYAGRRTPRVRWPWVLVSALIAPLQALGGLLGGNTFAWRGRRIRLARGGRFEVVPPASRRREQP